ncbi:hypothetical protein [Burkholderia alba]|uniref:hypothetical protein n=1 Tax=Burkholderia alba TaxID=2683677 RepID=UPI002B059895|nr:hypothetical protein [Burkholderia alba]
MNDPQDLPPDADEQQHPAHDRDGTWHAWPADGAIIGVKGTAYVVGLPHDRVTSATLWRWLQRMKDH